MGESEIKVYEDGPFWGADSAWSTDELSLIMTVTPSPHKKPIYLEVGTGLEVLRHVPWALVAQNVSAEMWDLLDYCNITFDYYGAIPGIEGTPEDVSRWHPGAPKMRISTFKEAEQELKSRIKGGWE